MHPKIHKKADQGVKIKLTVDLCKVRLMKKPDKDSLEALDNETSQIVG